MININDTFDKGTIINNRYIVSGLIGHGGMGYVYLVRDTLKANMEIALKTFKGKMPESPEHLAIFKQEFIIMTRLKHPNLVNVFNFGFDDQNDCHYITMEFLQGLTLKQILKSDTLLEEDRAIDIIVKLARGLEFIHSRNIISRDVKPSNITVSGDNVKLMDFGISDIGKVDQKKIKGSLIYIAPEILVGEADHRVDIYSLGTVLLQMLTGRIIYHETKATSILNLIKDEYLFLYNQSVILDKVRDSRLRDIIDKMIAYNKDERYQSCSAIIADINKKLGYSYDIETQETKDAYVTGVNFVNRETEIRRIKDRIFSPRRKSKMFMLLSNIGLGKSKIFNEIKKFSQLNNILFCECECYKSMMRPYQPVSQLLEQIKINANPGLIEKYDKYIRKITYIKSIDNDEGMDREHSPKEEAEILNQGLINFFLEFGYQVELLTIIYINNMNWIDDASFEIISGLLKHISKKENQGNKLRIFASARNESAKRIKDRIRDLEEQNYIEVLKLKPFILKSVISYFENVFGSTSIDKTLRDSIRIINRRIGGNPLFLSEFIRFALKESIIDKKGNKWILTEPVSVIKVPAGLNEIIEQRLEPYLRDEFTAKFLNVFAFIRFSLSFNHICKFFSNMDHSIIRDIIQELENQEILKAERIGNNLMYCLSHELIRDIVVKAVRDKKGLHSLVGDKIEDIFKDNITNYFQELAYHFKAAGNKEKAIFYLKKSASVQRSKYFNIKDILNFYNEALQIAVCHYGRDSYETGMLRGEIGMVYYEEGDFQSALSNCLASAGIIKGIYGYNSDKYAYILSRLCQVYLKMGDYKKALIYGTEALDLQIHFLGENSLFVANSYSIIAQIYLKTGDYADALEVSKKTYQIYLKRFGADSREMIYPINLMGIVYFDMAELDKAKDCFFQTMKLQTTYYGKGSIESTSSYNNLGLVLLEQAFYSESLFYLKKNLKILKAFYRNPHLDIAKCYNNMGIVYHSLKENDKAFRYYRMALNIRKRFYGEMHTRTAGSYNNIGTIYFDRGEFDKALEYYQKALDIQKAIFGKYHTAVAKGYTNIGYIYNELKDYDKALSYFETAHNIRLRIHKDDHTDIANSYHGFAVVCRNRGDYSKALENLNKVLEIYLKFYGEDHTSTANAYSMFSGIYEDMKNYEKALYYNKKVIEIYGKIFGKEHPYYIEIIENRKKLKQYIASK